MTSTRVSLRSAILERLAAGGVAPSERKTA